MTDGAGPSASTAAPGETARKRRDPGFRLAVGLGAAICAVLLARGELGVLFRALVEPGSARVARPLPPGLAELAAAARRELADGEAVLYDSPLRPEAFDPNAERFADGRPRPEADEPKEWTRRLLAPHRVYARGPFEPDFPRGEPAPRLLIVFGGRLASPAFLPVLENGAGGVYRRVAAGGG